MDIKCLRGAPQLIEHLEQCGFGQFGPVRQTECGEVENPLISVVEELERRGVSLNDSFKQFVVG
ncbi:hypothetical protein DI14_02785 [Exiguobacterium sp. AB2]|nr:hypothetical protein DI14_02785 [Exiguobacterium sp. AB2]